MPVKLTVADRLWLEQTAQSALTPRRLAEHCRSVLWAAEGQRNEQIATAPGYAANKVGCWRTRFAKGDRAGIEQDAPGRGRKPT